MGRVLRLAWIPVALTVAAFVAVAVAAGNAPGAPAAPAVNPTFTLVQLPKSECPEPKVILGKGCWDKSGQILSVYWSVNDGKAAWDQPGFTTTYEWSLPQTIGPSGAGIKLKLTALWKSGGLICPAFGPRGAFPLKDPKQDPALGVCAKQDQPSATLSKTVNVVAISGGPAYIAIGLQDGPQITYKYVVKKPACRKLSDDAVPEPPYLVDFNGVHSGVPARHEAATLRGAFTSATGKLSICSEHGPNGVLAAYATGTIHHNEVFVYKGRRRVEKLTMKVTRGSWAGKSERYNKVALVVEVTASTDDRCPDGVTGRLTLTEDKAHVLDSSMSLRLCGANHTHLYEGAAKEIQVKVLINARD